MVRGTCNRISRFKLKIHKSFLINDQITFLLQYKDPGIHRHGILNITSRLSSFVGKGNEIAFPDIWKDAIVLLPPYNYAPSYYNQNSKNVENWGMVLDQQFDSDLEYVTQLEKEALGCNTIKSVKNWGSSYSGFK